MKFYNQVRSIFLLNFVSYLDLIPLSAVKSMTISMDKNGVYVPSILMQKFRGKVPQNAGNGISGCLDLKIFQGRMPPDPPSYARFLRGTDFKK